MSDTEVDGLRRDMKEMHKQNQNDRKEDRTALTDAMREQGDRFERGLESLRQDLIPIRDQGMKNGFTVEQLVGDGSEGAGRIGRIEIVMEKLKQFRWQALGIIGFVGYLVDHFWHH